MLVHKTYFLSGICQICMTLAQRWRNVVHIMPTVSQLSNHISTIFQRWANVVILSGALDCLVKNSMTKGEKHTVCPFVNASDLLQ